jgi:hypothetical protein
MDDIYLELGLNLFSDSDISDDSDEDSDEESEDERRRHNIRICAALRATKRRRINRRRHTVSGNGLEHDPKSARPTRRRCEVGGMTSKQSTKPGCHPRNDIDVRTTNPPRVGQPSPLEQRTKPGYQQSPSNALRVRQPSPLEPSLNLDKKNGEVSEASHPTV